MVTWFYGITVVPLATATAVNFTAPLFATIAAVFVLLEDREARVARLPRRGEGVPRGRRADKLSQRSSV